MSIQVYCARCKKELSEPGALVFSPPEASNVCKFHICVACWKELFKVIE